MLSEITRRHPDQQVIDWLNQMDEATLFIIVITIGEILKGYRKLQNMQRRKDLETWLTSALLSRFPGRILPIDTDTLLCWGSLIARLESMGQPMGAMDSLILASAKHNDLTIVTRNASDFLQEGTPVINPWEQG